MSTTPPTPDSAGPARLLHADADSFYVSVALRSRPDLVEVPVAAVFVASANYPARDRGVRAGMAVTDAVRRCPELTVLDVPRTEYEAVGDALFALFCEVADTVEPGSIEEAFLDVGARTTEQALTAGTHLRRRVAAELGIAVSVGVGRTKLMAKLASRAAKPDGLHVIEGAQESALRSGLLLEDVWGVGQRTRQRLHALGVHRVEEVDRLGEGVLHQVCGTTMARRLTAIREGTDDAVVRPVTSRTSMSAEDSTAGWARPDRTPAEMLERCVGRVCHRVARAGLAATELKLALLQAPDGASVTSRRTGLRPTADPAQWLPLAHLLLDAADPAPLVGLQITLAGLLPADTADPTLF